MITIDIKINDTPVDKIGRFIDGHGITHWAEVTGPEQKEKSNEVD